VCPDSCTGPSRLFWLDSYSLDLACLRDNPGSAPCFVASPCPATVRGQGSGLIWVSAGQRFARCLSRSPPQAPGPIFGAAVCYDESARRAGGLPPQVPLPNSEPLRVKRWARLQRLGV
jgi:hypothetical protein